MNSNQYLTQRVGKVIVGSDRIYNHGCLMIAEYPAWEFVVDDIVELAWDTLLHYCVHHKESTCSASAKLTFVSMAVGLKVSSLIDLEKPTPKEQISLGDLLIEAFLQDNKVIIERAYEGIKAPYMIRVIGEVDLPKPVLVGTSFNKPEPITSHRSPITKETFIKGWSEPEQFSEYLNRPFMRALETLRQQPWVINKSLLDIAKQSPPPKEFITEDGEILTAKTSKDVRALKLASKHYEYQQVINKASMIGDREFYQEVFCDYRGRVYYAESFLSYQGGELARSLMMFSNKQEITSIGYRWLCIKAACSYNQSYDIENIPSWVTTDYKRHLEDEGLDTISVDKMTLDDRYLWVINNPAMVADAELHQVVDPKAEKPYSWLACCLEMSGYRNALARGERYYSGFPVGVDGQNNGWQHLAAMSKDSQAGALVSLTKSSIQRDFYVSVAKVLVQMCPEWFAGRGMPMKHIRKGIAKRGSMTRAYSAGKKRIAVNMWEDLYSMGFNDKYSITEDDCDMLSGHLINAINKVCQGPLKTTKYLQKLANMVLDGGDETIDWISPSGFPVKYIANLQHEKKQRGSIKGIKGSKDGRVMHVIKVDVTNKETGGKVPCKRSFASGIAPNVVHSLDAAHLANTIVSFGESFAAVHDSFACHADDVDFLIETTKRTFIAQYDVSNFFDILQEMLVPKDKTVTVDQPTIGDLDINGVTSSDYFFC